MLSRMVRNDFHPRTRNGQPHQSTTGVASTSSSQRAVPLPDPGADRQPQHRPHGDREERHRQHRPHREPPPEVDQLRVRPLVRRRHPLRLQRHAADRAVPRPHLLDLGMHRAGIDRPRRHRLRPPAQVLRRLSLELGLAARRAEVEPLACVLRHMPRGRPVHLHPAHRIGRRNVAFRVGGELRPASLAAEVVEMPAMLVPRLARLRIDSHPADRIPHHRIDRRNHAAPPQTGFGTPYAASSNWKVKGSAA